MIIEEKSVRKPRVLVVGDILLDEWVYGDANRLSPEAPIPIFDVKYSTKHLGGAGNVLANLKAMNTDPMIISGVSETKDGHIVKKMVSNICGENTFYFNITESFKKQRICANNQQIVRIDTGSGKDISKTEIDEYLDRLKGKVDIVLVSDYGKGAVNDYVLMEVSNFCHDEKMSFLIDPYMSDSYEHENFFCTLMKFNNSEAEYFSKTKIENENDITIVGRKLMDKFDTESILITLGINGMAYFDREKYYKNPYRVKDNPLHIYDVCGAGDSVFAVLGYLISGTFYGIESIIEIAAKAGKLAVSKRGTSVVKYEELFDGNDIKRELFE